MTLLAKDFSIPDTVPQLVYPKHNDGRPTVRNVPSSRVWRNQYHPMREHLFSVADRMLPRYKVMNRSSRPSWVQRRAKEMEFAR